jgi:uncharacterized membrane protein YesL
MPCFSLIMCKRKFVIGDYMNNNKLFYFFQTLYEYFKVSLYFWLSLIKGLVVYALVPAVCALVFSIHEISEGKANEETKTLFKEYFNKFKQYKIQSFSFSLIFFVLYAALFYLSKQAGDKLTMFFIIVCVYLIALVAVLFIYSVYFLLYRQFTFKKSLIFSFVTAIKNLFYTMAILILIGALLYSAYLNFAFFMIFSPFLFGLAVKSIFIRLKQ